MNAVMGGFANCLEPATLLAMFLAVLLGIVIGGLPGFGAATGLILILPLTYSLDPGIALVAMVGVYVGAEYGGSISSILLNTPGTGGAVVTCFDGYPLARKGQPGRALLYSNIASCIGGVIGGVIMLVFLPLLVNFAFLFGAGEIFFMALLGLTLVGTISNGDLPKGIISIALGILLSTVGTDAASGVPRFYFDFNELFSGIPTIPVMLGLFSLPYLAQGVIRRRRDEGEAVIRFPRTTLGDNLRLFLAVGRDMLRRMKLTLLRSSLFGILIGIIPGVGATVATFLSYSTAKDSSPHPEEFGHGAPEGIVAPESANNAIVGGSLIPVLSLGIPGSPAAAVFMGAIFMHGLMPGPSFMEHEPVLVYTVVCAVIVASLMQIVFGAWGIGFLANILKVPLYFLLPAVVPVCAIGAYSMRGIGFDIELFVLFGILGFVLIKLNYSIAAIMLGMILGKITEVSLTEAINISASRGGLWSYFIHRPLSMALCLIFLAYLVYVIVSGHRRNQKRKRAALKDGTAVIPRLGQGLRRLDLAGGLLFVLAACVLLPEAQSYPRTAGIFPTLALGLLLFGGGLVLCRSLFRPVCYAGTADGPFASVSLPRAAVLFLMVIAYVAAMLGIGFYVSTLVFCLGVSLYIRRVAPGGTDDASLGRRLLVHSAFTLIFAAAVYFVFSWLFMLQLPDRLLP